MATFFYNVWFPYESKSGWESVYNFWCDAILKREVQSRWLPPRLGEPLQTELERHRAEDSQPDLGGTTPLTPNRTWEVQSRELPAGLGRYRTADSHPDLRDTAEDSQPDLGATEPRISIVPTPRRVDKNLPVVISGIPREKPPPPLFSPDLKQGGGGVGFFIQILLEIIIFQCKIAQKPC